MSVQADEISSILKEKIAEFALPCRYADGSFPQGCALRKFQRCRHQRNLWERVSTRTWYGRF